MKCDVCIIGAGLFGSMTAKFLRRQGFDVLIVDRVDPMAASKCSSGIWRDGWIGKIREKASLSFDVLEEFVDIQLIDIFDVDKNQMSQVNFIDCNNILNEKFLRGNVTGGIWTGGHKLQRIIVEQEQGKVEIEANFFVVATGAYTTQTLASFNLVVPFGLDAGWGAVLHCKEHIQRDFIQNWAPYKQLYGLNLIRGDGKCVSYFTTGTSVKNPPPGGDKRTLAGGERMVNFARSFGMKKIDEILEGLRPSFSTSDFDYVYVHAANVLSATGGAKNSTVLSGYVAARIFDEITN